MKYSIFFIICCILISCNKKTEIDIDAIFIYKYKNPEYRYKCYVQMSKDKSHIAGKTHFQDTLYIGSKELENHYILDSGVYIMCDDELMGMCGNSSVGMETAISRISRLDYERFNMPFDSIAKNIIDTDPFEEFYYRNRDTFYYNRNLYSQLDEYIRNNELVSKLGFKKLK